MKLWRCIRNTPFGKERSLCNSQKFWLQQLLTGGLLLELGAVVRGRQGVDLRWSILHTRTLQLSRIYMDFSNTCQSFGSWALNGRAEKKNMHIGASSKSSRPIQRSSPPQCISFAFCSLMKMTLKGAGGISGTSPTVAFATTVDATCQPCPVALGRSCHERTGSCMGLWCGVQTPCTTGGPVMLAVFFLV